MKFPDHFYFMKLHTDSKLHAYIAYSLILMLMQFQFRILKFIFTIKMVGTDKVYNRNSPGNFIQ